MLYFDKRGGVSCGFLRCLFLGFAMVFGCASLKAQNSSIQPVASFIGQQVTGVSVSKHGRIFVNFPRWREGVQNAVLELKGSRRIPFPNKEWNSWEIGDSAQVHKFIGVQSVLAHGDFLYVLDTRNPRIRKVLDAPRIFVFDLSSGILKSTYILDNGSFHENSYINDLRVDDRNGKIYLTDSNNPGLVVVDLKTGHSKRVLDGHYSTSAEVSFLTFGGVKKMGKTDADGIALDTQGQRLFYHAMNGYSLFSIDLDTLNHGSEQEIERAVRLEGKTPAPDGMIFDKKGNLYLGDIEHNKIVYRKKDGSLHLLCEGSVVGWADTFSIYDGYLYFTNSRISEAHGDIAQMAFTLNRIQLP